MKTTILTDEYQYLAPDGAEVRLLMNTVTASAARIALPSGKISKPVTHRTVSEIWHIISGQGQIWRRQGEVEQITDLVEGVTIDIPLGTDFQFRSNHGVTLEFVCITTPPWPGEGEVKHLDDGAWLPTA